MNDYLLHSYHTHTWRCGHADGSDRDYIERAIQAGIRVLGFSDHIPMPPSALSDFQGIRMPYEAAEEYVKSLSALRDEYSHDISILIGYEGEFCAEFFDIQMEYLKGLGLDYLILGQHFIPCQGTYLPAPQMTISHDTLTSYVDTCIAGIRTGSYLYLAHPDLINYQGDLDFYNSEMLRLCRFCKEQKVPLEINLHGLLDCRHYPSDRFFRIAGQVGNDVVLGIDAHTPEEIGNKENYRKACELVSLHGLNLIETPVFPVI